MRVGVKLKLRWEIVVDVALGEAVERVAFWLLIEGTGGATVAAVVRL